PSVLAAFVPPATPDPQGSTPGVNNPDAPLVYGVAPFTINGQQYIALTDINSGLWVIQESGAPQFAITTTSMPNGTVGASYSVTLNAINAVGDVSYALVGTAPPPLTLSTGVLSGTPTTAGTYTFAIEASDSAGDTVTQQYTVTINTNLTITTESPLPEATTNEAYSQTFGTVNGSATVTWAVSSGSLPAGMSLDASTGALTGTPTVDGVSNFTVKVTGTGGGTDSVAYTLQVAPLTISTTSLANGDIAATYSESLSMANGTAPFTFVVASGSLPAGLALSSTGQITGTPTANGAVSNFTIKVTDADGQTATQALSITIGGMAITSTTLANGVVGTGYLQQIVVANGTVPYTFAVTSGSLPPGLTLSAANSSGNPGATSGDNGFLAGVPTTAATYNFTIQATDKNGLTAKQAYTVVITQ
ncbi:MAG: putative Ig domain-containing protein, partial [Terriglobales bacterium]